MNNNSISHQNKNSINKLSKKNNDDPSIWKPTGNKIYTVDTKPTVIRPRKSSSVNSEVFSPLPLRLENIQTDGSSLSSSKSTIATEVVENMINKVKESVDCASCNIDKCCAAGQKPCSSSCKCKQIQAWVSLKEGSDNAKSLPSSSSMDSDDNRSTYLKPPLFDQTYEKSWRQVPVKYNPVKSYAVSKETRANFNFLGWNSENDYITTTQSLYGTCFSELNEKSSNTNNNKTIKK